MLWCKINHFLLSAFPVNSWKDFLIRSHIQKCKRCKSQMASRDEVKALIIHERDVANFGDLWPAVKTGILRKKPGKKAAFTQNRRWVYAAASVVLVFLAGFLLFTVLSQNGVLTDQEGEVRFQINSIRVGDAPATPYLYQPKDSDMILVWAEKSI